MGVLFALKLFQFYHKPTGISTLSEIFIYKLNIYKLSDIDFSQEKDAGQMSLCPAHCLLKALIKVFIIMFNSLIQASVIAVCIMFKIFRPIVKCCRIAGLTVYAQVLNMFFY